MCLCNLRKTIANTSYRVLGIFYLLIYLLLFFSRFLDPQVLFYTKLMIDFLMNFCLSYFTDDRPRNNLCDTHAYTKYFGFVLYFIYHLIYIKRLRIVYRSERKCLFSLRLSRAESRVLPFRAASSNIAYFFRLYKSIIYVHTYFLLFLLIPFITSFDILQPPLIRRLSQQ